MPRHPDKLLVRARRKKDLENLFGKDVLIARTPNRDYRWRTVVDREEFALLVAESIRDIDYTNFKASTADHDLHNLYASMWRQHYKYQHRDPTEQEEDSNG